MDAKFAVGDKVDLSPRDKFVGTVKAVFTTKEGETRYAVDVEGHGTLDFAATTLSFLMTEIHLGACRLTSNPWLWRIIEHILLTATGITSKLSISTALTPTMRKNAPQTHQRS